jgi:enoyl-CoA hydratase
MENSDFIRIWNKGYIAFIQLNRPEKANAYNETMLDILAGILENVETDVQVRVLIISGAGNRSFCAGADFYEIHQRNYADALNLKSAKVFDKIALSPKITLAAINGSAAGGGLELALACDIRIAVEDATFFFPETKLGLIPAAGGTRRLPRIVGIPRAKELILGGRVWNAKDALRWGLVNEVVQCEDLLAQAHKWGEEIAQRDPVALQLAKKSLDTQSQNGLASNFELVSEALLYQLKRESKTCGNQKNK